MTIIKPAVLIGGCLLAVAAGTAPAAEMDHSAHQGHDMSSTADVPEGFHRMPDGTIMANNPDSAAAPPGYHLMPDGTLMANSGGGDHSAHHNHGAGGWMFDYRYTRMSMDGMMDGSSDLSSSDVFAWNQAPAGGYLMTPTSMNMDMHMFMVMYGLTDKMMLMGMLHYMSNDMEMDSAPVGTLDCGSSTMKSSGLADTIVGVMYQASPKIVVTGNVSLPTGSIDEEGSMLMVMNHGGGANMCMQMQGKQPYSMQLGSGTFDLMPSVSYQDKAGNWGWGVDAEYVYRLGENDNNYTLGNRFKLDLLGSFAVAPAVMGTGRLSYTNWEAISGADQDIEQTMMVRVDGAMVDMGSTPTADPDNYGGTRTDFYIGMNGRFGGGHMIGFELGVPVQQDLNGPQMKTDMIFSLGYQYMMM